MDLLLHGATERELDPTGATAREVLLELDVRIWVYFAIDEGVDVTTNDLARDHPFASLVRR